MKRVSKAAAQVLDRLTEGLANWGDHRKVDNAPGAFVPVSVENVGNLGNIGPLFSVTHYVEQQGDLMRDPEMIFLRGGDGSYYPTYYRNDFVGAERFSVREDENGQIRVAPREQADQAVFAGTWMRNIKEQQFG